jgi:hypothetical protein
MPGFEPLRALRVPAKTSPMTLDQAEAHLCSAAKVDER